MPKDKVTFQQIADSKGKHKITMLTAYDYPLGSIADEAGIDIILVGDSLANVVLGLDSTKDVTLEQMLYHTQAVRRAVKNALLVGDMPFEAYQLDSADALNNARRFIDEAGCNAVKLEWFAKCAQITGQIIKSGIPVMGHIGLTPQTADKLGGFRVQGKDAEQAVELIRQAKALEKEGCFALILECVPERIAGIITQGISIPTIGIGAGRYCDGQVLVIHDLIGLSGIHLPKFVKKFVDARSVILAAIEQYAQEVRKGIFPSREHSYEIKDAEFDKVKKAL
ncbi:MAG: 3-methyl-2-oxobutanoate hydroxymethyltransferase [Candidatus Omnitrophota bacterium]|nr:3-methyl-2-oxobutanoate hydroxymethyltransferase [Candidatus Omnitrophota bacterium]